VHKGVPEFRVPQALLGALEVPAPGDVDAKCERENCEGETISESEAVPKLV